MRYLAVVMAFLIVFSPAVAAGQDYVRFRLPEGHRCTVAAETYQCFDLGEYTELLHIDEDLRHLTELHAADLARIEALSHAADELRLSLDLTRANVETLEAERTRLTHLWEEENRLRHEAENRPSLDWIPWTLAGGFAIATLVLGIVIGVQ